MTRSTTKLWWVCETDHGKPCLYADEGKGGSRCTKHGSILIPTHWLTGKSRKNARAELNKVEGK